MYLACRVGALSCQYGLDYLSGSSFSFSTLFSIWSKILGEPCLKLRAISADCDNYENLHNRSREVWSIPFAVPQLSFSRSCLLLFVALSYLIIDFANLCLTRNLYSNMNLHVDILFQRKRKEM